MAAPTANLEIEDPGLGQVAAGGANAEAKIGVCTKGTPETIYAIGSKSAAVNSLGAGPLVDAIVQRLSVAGGPVYACPSNPSQAGSVSATTLVGSGSATVVGSAGPDRVIDIKIILGGAVGVATFQWRVGGGNYSTTTTTAATFKVPGTLTTVAFAAGTYVANDVYTLNLNGTITRVGTGTATLLDGSTHNVVDNLSVKVEVITAGAPGAGVFSYSLDGGNNFSADILIPSGGKYVVPGVGLVITFSGTFVLGDVYSFTTATCGSTTGEIATCIDKLLADPRTWGYLHVVGTPANAAAAATLASTVDTKVQAAKVSFRYVRALTECPQTESDGTILAAFTSFASADGRVNVVVGDTDLVSDLTARTDRRNLAWAYAARLGEIPISEHPGRVRRGALKNVRKIYRDEAATPGLNDQRFVTAKTHVGKPGFFITAGKTMAAAGSDFDEIQRGRVMDRACTVARAQILEELNENVRVDKKTGFIDERDAQRIEGLIRSALRTAIVATGDASDVTVSVDRNENILSSSSLPIDIGVVPLAYLSNIKAKIGFVNPALEA